MKKLLLLGLFLLLFTSQVIASAKSEAEDCKNDIRCVYSTAVKHEDVDPCELLVGDQKLECYGFLEDQVPGLEVEEKGLLEENIPPLRGCVKKVARIKSQRPSF